MRLKLFIWAMLAVLPAMAASESTRKERNFITAGNDLYGKSKYFEAQKEYEKALELNPNSAVARYNLGLSQIRLSTKEGATEEETKKIKESAVQNMQAVAQLGATKPELAGKANYNLGNLAFNTDDYKGAIDFYKQALRLNPSDEAARRNLRIAQKKIQNQDKKEQNKDQNQDQQDQNKDQNQDQNKDQNQDQQDKQDQQQQQQNQDQQQQERMNPQAAEQILKAIENKENNTRARVANPGKGDKARDKRNRKNW